MADHSLPAQPHPGELYASTETYSDAASSYWVERRRLAAELRELGSLLLSRQSNETEISALADQLAQFNQRIKHEPEIAGRKGWMDAGLLSGPDVLSVELSPLVGKSSSVGPVLKVWVEKGEGRAEVNCDWRFEGPPRCLHGGYIAAIFDEFLGWAQMLSGGAGATKNLSVTYHHPTPLNENLALTARLLSVEGRKIRVIGEMYAGERMTASAEGLFISFGAKGTTELYKNL
jgi:acyl-coenzyme A thioesterase PaaI-like protein